MGNHHSSSSGGKGRKGRKDHVNNGLHDGDQGNQEEEPRLLRKVSSFSGMQDKLKQLRRRSRTGSSKSKDNSKATMAPKGFRVMSGGSECILTAEEVQNVQVRHTEF